MRLLLPILLLATFSRAQYSRSFFASVGATSYKHAIVAPSNGTAVFASVNSMEEFPQSGEIILTIGEVDNKGETSDYFREDLSFLGSQTYEISGYGTNNNELILAILGSDAAGYSLLHYLRFDRVTNSIVQVESAPYQLLYGFVRSKQVGNDLVTYAMAINGDLVRVKTSVSDVSVSSIEQVAPAGATVSPIQYRKRVDFISASNGVEFIAMDQNIYKRSPNGTVINTTAPSWLTNMGYDLGLSASNDLVILVSNMYNVFDTTNLSVQSNGIISGNMNSDNRFLEFIEDQGNYIVYAAKLLNQNSYRFKLDSNFNLVEELNIGGGMQPIETIKENDKHYMVGLKLESVYTMWGIGIVYTNNNGTVLPFEEYDREFEHNNLVVNTGHLNESFNRSYVNSTANGFGYKHNGIRKSLIYSTWNNLIGKDQNNNLTGMLTLYNTEDQLPGPYIPQYGPGSFESYDRHNRSFYVTREMIDYHRQFAIFPWYEPPFGIKYWPGNGDVLNGQAQYVAPYYDENNDGTYNPEEGDYPLIYGDNCYLNVFHLKDSATTNADNITIDVLQYIYTYNCDTSDVLRNTVFMTQEFTLREGVLSEAYVNSFVDTDLGYYGDDFMGTNVELGMVYCYNADLLDQNTGAGTGYQDTLPAVGIMMLQGAKVPEDGMDNLVGVGVNQCTNGVGFDDGIVDNEFFGVVNSTYAYTPFGASTANIFNFYNMYKGLYWDGTPQEVNGVTITHAYYGSSDSLHYTSGGIDPGTDHYEFGPISNNGSGDRRVNASTGPLNLNAADPNNNSVTITNAYVVAMDTINLPNGNLLAPVDYLFELGTNLKQMYATNDAGCGHDFGPYITQVPVGLEELELNAIIYPNPTFDEVHIVLKEAGEFTAEIYDLNGSRLISQTSTQQLTVDTSLWKSGVYMVVITNGVKQSRKKLVKL